MDAYILIGGRSSRMGEEKAGVLLHGRTMLERIVAAARPAFRRLFAVQRAGGAAAPGIETLYEHPHEERAPALGVLAALEHAHAPAFVVAVDFPLLTTTLLEYLRQSFEDASPSLLMPEWNGRPQTLCAVYSASVLPTLRERITANRYDLRGLVDACAGMLLDEGVLRRAFPGEPLMSVNTPEELEVARTLLQESAPAERGDR